MSPWFFGAPEDEDEADEDDGPDCEAENIDEEESEIDDEKENQGIKRTFLQYYTIIVNKRIWLKMYVYLYWKQHRHLHNYRNMKIIRQGLTGADCLGRGLGGEITKQEVHHDFKSII